MDNDDDDDDFLPIKKRKRKDTLPLQCQICNASFSKRSNLLRHQKNLHKDSVTSTGTCLCFDCGKRFQKIVLLKKHLIEDHAMTLVTDQIHHDNEQGRY